MAIMYGKFVSCFSNLYLKLSQLKKKKSTENSKPPAGDMDTVHVCFQEGTFWKESIQLN